MASMSLFQAKNTIGSKMKRSIINLCNGDDSTSTLNQHHYNTSAFTSNSQYSNSYACQKLVPESTLSSHHNINETMKPKRKVTLEEMILQLEMEEEVARKEKLKEIMQQTGRRSCVNNSDILRSARNALNQYPRFSLDGRDAMYRNFNHAESETKRMPSSYGGERVVWCKPGVVARLMGLEAMPVPVIGSKFCSKEKLKSMMKRQSLRLMAERRENERKKRMMELLVSQTRNGNGNGSCSRNGEYCVVNSVAAQQREANVEGVFRARRYG